jgi:hypothetical protein
MAAMSKIVCAYCEHSITVNRDGKVRKHGACRGSGRHESGFQRSPVAAYADVNAGVTVNQGALSMSISQITDKQIHALRTWAERCVFTGAGSISQLCGFALGVLSPEAPGYKPSNVARARCAEIINILSRMANEPGQHAQTPGSVT